MEMYAWVRRACMVEGMSIREAARELGLHRDTVRKMLKYSIPLGYGRSKSVRRPNLTWLKTAKLTEFQCQSGLVLLFVLQREQWSVKKARAFVKAMQEM